MIAGAGSLIFSVFASINGFSNLGINISQVLNNQTNNSAINENNLKQNSKSPSCSDIDKDGLCDNEEPLYRTDPLNPDTDGDGFLDGEEAATGCSPISASPKDCDLKNLKTGLNKSKINLTEYFSSLIIGGLLSGDLDKANPDFQKHLEKLAGEASQIQKTLLSVDNSDLKIIGANDDSKSASQEYLNNLENILAKYFFKKGEKIDADNLNSVDFSPYLDNLDNLYEELSKLAPPPNWLDLHKGLLKFFFELKNFIQNLTNQENDSVKALLTFKNAGGLFDDYEKIVKEISTKIIKDDLKTKFFNL